MEKRTLEQRIKFDAGLTVGEHLVRFVCDGHVRDAVVKAEKVIASCTNEKQLDVARRYALRAFHLMEGSGLKVFSSPLWADIDAVKISWNKFVNDRVLGKVGRMIEKRRREIDPDYAARKREEFEKSWRRDFAYGGPATKPSDRVNVNVVWERGCNS